MPLVICVKCGGATPITEAEYVTDWRTCVHCGEELHKRKVSGERVPAPGPKIRDEITIEAFWREVSELDVKDVRKKLQAYGSLSPHAQYMLALVGRPNASVREGTEIAIASYVAGKLTRIISSLSQGVLPDIDCWDDLARYAMIARYVRKHGEWP